MDAYDRALKLLAMREHSVKELKNKLVSKGYGKEEIEDAVQMLIGEGSLSDKRFAYAFVRSRLRRNPEGMHVLLLSTGIFRPVTPGSTRNKCFLHLFQLKSAHCLQFSERAVRANGVPSTAQGQNISRVFPGLVSS